MVHLDLYKSVHPPITLSLG